MSVRQQIRDQAIAELNADPSTGVPLATKRRFLPGQLLREPRIAVFFDEEDANRPQGPRGAITSRNVVLAIQCVVQVEEPEQADDTLEPILEHVVAVMGDTNLAKLATDVAEISTRWAADSSSALFILAAITRWRVQFQTQKNDLSRKQ